MDKIIGGIGGLIGLMRILSPFYIWRTTALKQFAIVFYLRCTTDRIRLHDRSHSLYVFFRSQTVASEF